jgi:hypothetical protein
MNAILQLARSFAPQLERATGPASESSPARGLAIAASSFSSFRSLICKDRWNRIPPQHGTR